MMVGDDDDVMPRPENREKHNENLLGKRDDLNANNADLATLLDNERQKTTKLSKENTDFHNEIAAYQQEIEKLEQKLKDAEDASKSKVKNLEQSKSDSTQQAEDAEKDKVLAQSELQKTKAQLEQEKEKSGQLQSLLESANSDLEEKEAEFRELRDVSDANEAGLRAAEEELIGNEEELVGLRQDRANLDIISQALSATFEDLGRDLNPDSIINYIDELQESRITKTSSNLSLHSDFKHTDARAKGGVRKTSVSDELQKASEIVDDDDEDASLEFEMLKESEAHATTLQQAEEKFTKRIEALERELDAERSARKAADRALEAEKKVHKTPIKVESPQELPHNPSVPWIQSCNPWHGQSLPAGDTGNKFWLYLMGLVLAIAFAHNYYLTWIERSSWLNANRDPTSQFYHEYMAQQPGPIFPLFELRSGPWINWIERDLLGYLEVLPG